MDFIGAECIVCKKKFIKDDDIVVCETCGTPYHRECYSKMGKCINDEFHINGWTFNQRYTPPQEVLKDNTNNQSVSLEKIEGSVNNNIGDNYEQMINISTDILNQSELNPNEEFSGITLLEFYLYTKSLRNTKRFYKSNTGEPTFSIFAILFPELYMVSKKLYVPATLIFLVEFMLSIPFIIKSYPYNIYELLMGFISEGTFKVICGISMILLCTFKVFIADKCLKLYFKDCIQKIQSIKHDSKLKKQSERSFFKRLLSVRNGMSILGMFALIFCGYILYYDFYVILTLLFMYFGG